MSTKPPAGILEYPDTNITKKIYSAVEDLSKIIPLNSDRYRLSFCINMYIEDKISTLLSAIEQANPWSSTVDYLELEKQISRVLKENNIVKRESN